MKRIYELQLKKGPIISFIPIIISLLTINACSADKKLLLKTAPGKADSFQIEGYIYKPKGKGPFPAVVLLHGCGGLDYHHFNWASQLVEWGYVAITPDSFTPRGYGNICKSSRIVSKLERAMDAFGAAEYLQKLNYVDKNRIGIIGFSHGGSTVLMAVQANSKEFAEVPESPFKAAVAYYPYCVGAFHKDLDIPTLLIIGENDDWTPASPCKNLKTWLVKPDLLELIVYEDTYHSFDRPRPYRTYLGHVLQYNANATMDSKERSKRFFDKYLKE